MSSSWDRGLCDEVTIEKRSEGILKKESGGGKSASGEGRSVMSLGENVLGSIQIPAEISSKRKYSLDEGNNKADPLFKLNFKKKPQVLCSNTFDSTDVPLQDGLKIGYQGSQWQIKWIIFDSQEEGKNKRTLSILKHLFRVQLADMTLQERISWDGSWTRDIEEILRACWLTVDSKELCVSHCLALIEVHKNQHLNPEVLKRAVLALQKQGYNF